MTMTEASEQRHPAGELGRGGVRGGFDGIYRSPLGSVQVPKVTLGQHVLFSTPTPDSQPALVDAQSGEQMTYGELRAAALAGARGLVAHGVRPGDAVALVGHNQPSFVVALHAALLAGAAVAPLNPAHTVAELAKQMGQISPSVVICSEASADPSCTAARAAGVRGCLVLGSHPHLPSFNELPPPEGFVALPELDPETAVALLPFSSGTSGLPKPVMLTHRNLVANLEQTRKGWKLRPGEVLVAALPFFHAYGFTIVLHCGLLVGSTVVTMPRFDANAYLGLLARYRCTRAHIVPAIARKIASVSDGESFDLSSLKYVVCGGAPLEASTLAQAELRLGCKIRQGYGLTEASPGTHQVFDDDFAHAPPGCVGRLSPSTEARVVVPDTEIDVPPGSSGELLIRGPQVMQGYLSQPEASAKAKAGEWLRTGDLARIDEDGFLFIEDRLKDVIKCNGFQVSPSELEAIFHTHPEVMDVAVVGVPHEARGEAPRAFVRTSRPNMEAELVEFIASRVARYKTVSSVVHVDEIPRSAAGKVLRRDLRSMKL